VKVAGFWAFLLGLGGMVGSISFMITESDYAQTDKACYTPGRPDCLAEVLERFAWTPLMLSVAIMIIGIGLIKGGK